MSDAGIEKEYEEQLQTAARYLDVIVTIDGDERVVRTFMDTPEGRGVAAKVADTWMELPAVEKVRVVPVGAGAERDRESRDTREVRPRTGQEPTASTRPTRCCQPQMLRKPSGPRLCHSLKCSDKTKRGEPIDVKTYAKHAEWGTT